MVLWARQNNILESQHTILHSDLVMDVGDSLNPAIDINQVAT